jgi:hypothetical protein
MQSEELAVLGVKHFNQPVTLIGLPIDEPEVPPAEEELPVGWEAELPTWNIRNNKITKIIRAPTINTIFFIKIKLNYYYFNIILKKILSIIFFYKKWL